MRMSNRWNRFIYWLWSPVYDVLLERLFSGGRKRAMDAAGLHAGERVCLVGVGTGTDLLYIPEGVSAVGVDLSEAMLDRARDKIRRSGCAAVLRVGDAQELPIEADTFDAAILNLILSVVPDPGRCMSEALRVLRPGGRIAIFDKFLQDGRKPSLARRLANAFSTLFGTDINRSLGKIILGLPCEVIRDEPGILGGLYRIVLLRKPHEPKTVQPVDDSLQSHIFFGDDEPLSSGRRDGGLS